MKTTQDKYRWSALREKAEALLKTSPGAGRRISRKSIIELIHELEVNQAELEIQNEELRESQRVLEESREQYANLYDFAPVGYLTLNRNGLITSINLTGARQLGLERKYVLGRNLARFVLPESRDALYRFCRRVFERDFHETAEIRFARKDACPMAAHMEGIPASDGAGNPTHCLVSVVDITERKQAEEQLKESQRVYSTLLQNLPGMAYRCRNDRNWTMEFVSEGCFDLTGLEPSEFTDKKKGFAQIIHPDDHGRVFNEAQNAVRKREAFRLEYRIRTPDGKEKWVWEQGRAVNLADGRWVLEGFITDVTPQKKQEEALRKSELRFRSMVENLPAGAVYVEGDSIRFNKTTGVITGYSNAEIPNLDAWFYKLYGDRAEALRRHHEEEKAAGFPEPRVVALRRRDGAIRLIRFAAYRIDERREVWLIDDVTDLEHARQELQNESNFVENLIETAQVIVLVLDTEGRIVRYNPYMQQVSGYALEEVRGKDWFHTFLPEGDRPRIQNIFRRVVDRIQMQGLNPIITKEGEERLIEWSNKTLKDAEGNTIGVLSIGLDVTERKQAEEDLRKNENWLRSLIETTQDAVVSIDGQGRIQLFNPAAERIFGYTRNEVQGRKVNMLMAERYAIEHDQYIARYESTGEARAIGQIRTVEGCHKNGTVFPVELSVAKVASGGKATYAAFIRDISEKSELQSKLIESERLAAVGATTASLAHEIRNPLNGMSITVELLRRRLGGLRNRMDPRIEPAVQSLMSEITRLNHLVEEFTSFARREAYRFQPVPVASLWEAVYEMEQESFRNAGIRVEQEIAPELSMVWMDKDRMKQALLNLCKNACEAMPAGGILTFRARRTDLNLLLEIADTGVGIPEGTNLYEPFNTTKPCGTGLGLMVVRKIIAAHRGAMTHESRPGNGTTVRLSLPLRPPPEASA